MQELRDIITLSFTLRISMICLKGNHDQCKWTLFEEHFTAVNLIQRSSPFWVWSSWPWARLENVGERQTDRQVLLPTSLSPPALASGCEKLHVAVDRLVTGGLCSEETDRVHLIQRPCSVWLWYCLVFSSSPEGVSRAVNEVVREWMRMSGIDKSAPFCFYKWSHMSANMWVSSGYGLYFTSLFFLIWFITN